MERIWDVFPSLSRAVKKSHAELHWPMLYCHDFDHVLRVGDRALRIAEDPRVGRLAGAAGLCHNADRILQKQRDLGRNGTVPDLDLMGMIDDWLDVEPRSTFTSADRIAIYDAVLRHSKRNGRDDGPVLVALQDADRTVNIELDVIIRKGQYFGDEVRVVDPTHLLDDPDATYADPRSILWTIKDDIACFGAVDGVASIRLPKARAIAERLFADAQDYLDRVLRQRADAGLIPYPLLD